MVVVPYSEGRKPTQKQLELSHGKLQIVKRDTCGRISRLRLLQPWSVMFQIRTLVESVLH